MISTIGQILQQAGHTLASAASFDDVRPHAGADSRGGSGSAGFFWGDRLLDRRAARHGGLGGAQPWTFGDRLRPALAAVPGHTLNFAWRYWNVTKEKRLGRGLEALLGQLPGWNGRRPRADGRKPQCVRHGRCRTGDDPHSPARRIAARSRSDRRVLQMVALLARRRSRSPDPCACRSMASATTPISRGRSSMPMSCNAWPTAFARTASCSRLWFDSGKAAISSSRASALARGAAGRLDRRAGDSR